MTTRDVLHKPQLPGGGGARTMRAELVATNPWTSDATATVLGSEDFEPDAAGLVTMKLRPNAEMAQADTYYRVRIARSEIVYFAVVPSSAGPFQLVNILVDPTTLNPVNPLLPALYQATAQKGQANGYASLDGSGKVPAAQLPASSGGGLQGFGTTGIVKSTFGPAGTSGTWTLAPAAFRVSTPAEVGDVLDWTPDIMHTTTADAQIDLVSVVSGAPARYLSTKTTAPEATQRGHAGFYIGPNHPRALRPAKWVVAAEDISAGTVTLALLYQAAGAGVTFGSADYPNEITLTNLGAPPS